MNAQHNIFHQHSAATIRRLLFPTPTTTPLATLATPLVTTSTTPLITTPLATPVTTPPATTLATPPATPPATPVTTPVTTRTTPLVTTPSTTTSTTTSTSKKRKRTESTIKGKKFKKLTDKNSINECIVTDCGCGFQCNKKFTLDEITQARNLYAVLTEKRKILFVRTVYYSQTPNGYPYNGINICEQFMKLIHGISKTKFKKVKSLIRNQFDFTTLNESNTRISKSNNKKIQFKIWFNSFVEKFGEPNPAEDEIHLTGYQHYRQVYDIYEAEVSTVYSFWHFKKQIKKEFPTVKLYKHTRLGICDICMKYCTDMKAGNTNEQQLLLRKQQEIHKEQFYQERKAYDDKIKKAKLEPEKYLSLIIDGATATQYPNIFTPSKSSNNITTLDVTNYGLIVHGRDCMINLLLPSFEGGSNLSLTIIYDYLVKLKKQHKLPKILFLQCDNCVKELKNKYAFGLLGLLCELDWFEEIYISTLLVGHTHTDIDRMFSYHSKYFKRNDCFNPQLFIDNIDNIYKVNKPKIEFLTKMYDFKNFIENYVYDFHYLRNNHGFKISKINGKIMLQSRKFNANDPSWSDHPLEIFKTKMDVLRVPDLVKPSPLPREDILKGIKKLNNIYSIDIAWFENNVKDDSPIYDNVIQSDFWNSNIQLTASQQDDDENEMETEQSITTSSSEKIYLEPHNGCVDFNFLKTGNLIAFKDNPKSKTYSIGEFIGFIHDHIYVSKYQYIKKTDSFENNQEDNPVLMFPQEQVLVYNFKLTKKMKEFAHVESRIDNIMKTKKK